MKRRNGFVSNSSSSSFIITDMNHPGVEILKLSDNIEIFEDQVKDLSDNATWNILSDHDINWREFLEQTYFNG